MQRRLSRTFSAERRGLAYEVPTPRGRDPHIPGSAARSARSAQRPGVTYPASGDLAVKRALLCGLAHAKLGQDEQSDAELREAQHLSDASNSALNGEVLQTEAIIQILPKPLTRGRRSLHKKSAGRPGTSGTHILEASDLLNLGLVDLQMKHYDEALIFLNAAAHLARPIQARALLEAALGKSRTRLFPSGRF